MKARPISSLLVAAFLLTGAAAFGQSPPPLSPTPPTKPLSESERIKALPEEERRWLTEFVAPIILPQEKKVFLELTEPYQREQFKQSFWERREQPGLPPPLGPGYKDRYQELRQLADEKYDGWTHDAGKMVIRYGEPESVFEPQGCPETFRDLEIWTYNDIGASGRQTARFIFYRPAPGAARRLWTLNDRTSDVFQPASCRKNFDDLSRDCSLTPGDSCVPCQDLCEVYQAYSEIRSRQGSGAGAAMDYAQILQPIEVSTEGLEQMKDKWATTSDAGAGKIHVEGPSSAAPGSVPTGSTTASSSKASIPAPARRKVVEEGDQGADREARSEIPRIPGLRGPDHHTGRARSLPSDCRELSGRISSSILSGGAGRSIPRDCASISGAFTLIA